MRWTAAGMLQAERQFRKIIGYSDLAGLVTRIDRERDERNQTQEAATLVSA